ncbi:hypothetical protein V2J09_017301 [Rumex salicifolius]
MIIEKIHITYSYLMPSVTLTLVRSISLPPPCRRTLTFSLLCPHPLAVLAGVAGLSLSSLAGSPTT